MKNIKEHIWDDCYTETFGIIYNNTTYGIINAGWLQLFNPIAHDVDELKRQTHLEIKENEKR